MDSINSAHTAFDKRRVRFSDWIVHYSVLFTLVFVGLAAASYYIVSDQYERQFSRVSAMHEVVHSVQDLSRRWQDVLAVKGKHNIASLLQAEREVGQRLQGKIERLVELPTVLSPTDSYTTNEQARLALSRLDQIKQIAVHRLTSLGQLQVTNGYLIPVVAGGWALLFVYLIWGWRRIFLDRRTALRFYHSQIDKRNDEKHLAVPIVRNDEFGDFARYLDSVLNSINYEMSSREDSCNLYQSAFSASLSLKALVNHHSEIIAVSEGLSELWVLEPSIIADVLGVDEHLSDLIGEVVNDSVTTAQSTVKAKIGKRSYELRCQPLKDGPEGGCLIEFVPVEEYGEIRILEATLGLMSSDVWDAPIRILDDSSPYYSFSTKLEGVRLQVISFISQINQAFADVDKGYPKITKLQQLSDLVIAKLNSNEASTDDIDHHGEQCEELALEVDVSRQDFLQVREQIELRFELYETYLEQLFEHQLAQTTWVSKVNEGLMDTKQAVLSLLSLVSGEPQKASVIEHSVIDLTHDIDAVLSEIVDSKPSYDGLGIEHIKSSESDLMMRLNDVQLKLDKLTTLTQFGSDNTHE